MKKWIPVAYKFPFWWLFKSPQRKLGWYTLGNDLRGLLHGSLSAVMPVKKGASLSICVGLYNRSETFLQYFVPSLLNLQDAKFIELSVFDCGSADARQVQEYLQKNWTGKLVFVSRSMPFARALAFNNAVEQSSGERIFLCDADFSLPPNLYSKVMQYTGSGIFWFPIVFYLYKHKPPVYDARNGEWMIWGGKGLVACCRKDYYLAGKLNEGFTTWGGEDEEFWLRVHRQGKIVIRSREKGLLHHWHPSLNPKYKLLETMADEGKL